MCSSTPFGPTHHITLPRMPGSPRSSTAIRRSASPRSHWRTVTRITTNRRTYDTPSTVEETFRFSEYLLNQPHCQIVEPGERHWSIFRRLCVEAGIDGPRVTDAWYAALAIEWGCEWITFDRDYARFPGLKWRAPSVA